MRHCAAPSVWTHRSPVSLQRSVVQVSASSHDRGAPAQVPAAVHWSPTVQKRPSSQVAPAARRDHADGDRDGSQTSQSFAGLRAPSATHWPPMLQLAAVVWCVHALASSSQASRVHVTPSSQSRGRPAQAPSMPQTSLVVQKRPSSHALPGGRGDHARAATPLAQYWQSSSGSIVPSGTHAPPMRQEPEATSWVQAPVPSSHVSVVHATPSSQSTATPAQVPAPSQTSSSVQASPSVHSVPCSRGIRSQSPVARLQTPTLQPSSKPAQSTRSHGLPASTPASIPASSPASIPASRPPSKPPSIPASTPASVPASVPASMPASIPASFAGILLRSKFVTALHAGSSPSESASATRTPSSHPLIDRSRDALVRSSQVAISRLRASSDRSHTCARVWRRRASPHGACAQRSSAPPRGAFRRGHRTNIYPYLLPRNCNFLY